MWLAYGASREAPMGIIIVLVIYLATLLPPVIALLTAILALVKQARQTHKAVQHLTVLTHSALERTLGRNAALELEARVAQEDRDHPSI